MELNKRGIQFTVTSGECKDLTTRTSFISLFIREKKQKPPEDPSNILGKWLISGGIWHILEWYATTTKDGEGKQSHTDLSDLVCYQIWINRYNFTNPENILFQNCNTKLS